MRAKSLQGLPAGLQKDPLDVRDSLADGHRLRVAEGLHIASFQHIGPSVLGDSLRLRVDLR